MIKLKMRSRLALSAGIIITFLALPTLAQTPDNEVQQTGALMMRRANKLVSRSTCQSLSVAKKLVVAYQALREDHTADLPDRSAALVEITSLVAQHCVVRTSSDQVAFVTTSTPIVVGGGGGVKCTTCVEVPGADGPGLLPKVVSTPHCSRCGEVDVLTLALLHMDNEARKKFLETLPPNVQEGIKEVFTNKKATVIEIVQEISQPSISTAPVDNSSVFVVPTESQTPTNVTNPFDLKPPILAPRTPLSTTVTPVQPDKP
jgi:hypothetical protein